jgi:1-acyl-sn-glycerol-3-phosphate acyltransferase
MNLTSNLPQIFHPKQLHTQLHTQQFTLPAITKETIKRAKEGVAYARCRQTNDMIEEALLAAEGVSNKTNEKGDRQEKTNGKFRQGLLKLFIRSLFRVKVENRENMPTTASVVVANHLNHIDPFLLLSELPANPFFHVLGDARTLYHSWWNRQFLRITKGVIPLERIWKEEMAVIEAAKSGREDLAQLAAEIQEYVPTGNSIETMRRIDRIIQATFKRGDGIMLFPEGRLGNTEGQLLPIKRGAIIYALRAGVPIVPIVLVGTKDLFLGKELTIRVGEPLHFPQSNRPKSHEVQAAVEQVEAAMLALLPKNYKESQGKKPFRNLLNHLFW